MLTVKTTMGEKLKDLRVERGLTTKQLCEMTQISEAVYNGLENDSPRDTGYSRIVTLAKFFNVPTDYLLGFTESRITKNIELKELGLSDNAVEVLMRHKQDNLLVSELIEHREFTDLMNAIDVYVRRVAAPNLAAMNDMINIAQTGLEMLFKDEEKPEGYDSAMRYISETQVNEDEFLRFRISERFNRILRDIYMSREPKVDESVHKRMDETKAFSDDLMNKLEEIKSGSSESIDIHDEDMPKTMVNCFRLAAADTLSANPKYNNIHHALYEIWKEWHGDEDLELSYIDRMWDEEGMTDVLKQFSIADLEILFDEDILAEDDDNNNSANFKPDLTRFTPPAHHRGVKRKRKR